MAGRQKKFSQAEEVALALAVEKYPTLWDCTITSYRRADLKPQLWQKVAAEVGPAFTVDDVSKRFKNMRETFSHNHRKVRESQRKCSGSALEDVFTPTWFLYKYLLYLVKTCAQAESTSNLEVPETGSSETAECVTQPSFYFDDSMQKFYVIPEDSDQQSVQSDFSDQSISLITVPSGPSSAPVDSASTTLTAPKRPASTPSASAPPSKSAPSDDYFFNKKGATKKNNNALLKSAVEAMEKIAAETSAPIILPEVPSNPRNEFVNFVGNRLNSLDTAARKQCENEILQVLLKY